MITNVELRYFAILFRGLSSSKNKELLGTNWKTIRTSTKPTIALRGKASPILEENSYSIIWKLVNELKGIL